MILTVRAPRYAKPLEPEDLLKLVDCTDPVVWAETFCQMLEDKAFKDGVDVDLMLTWFANCMAVGQRHP